MHMEFYENYPVHECRIIKYCTNGKRYSVNFVVVEQDFTPILGKQACEQMDLIKVIYENISSINGIMSKYEDVFS